MITKSKAEAEREANDRKRQRDSLVNRFRERGGDFRVTRSGVVRAIGNGEIVAEHELSADFLERAIRKMNSGVEAASEGS